MSVSFSIVTPSHGPDFARCRLLNESILRYVPDGVNHYVIVDRRDEALFRQLRSNRTCIVLKQEILPRWLLQIPFRPKWWLNLRGLPARGWIIQQITKLSVDAVCPTDAYLLVDSDIFFVRPHDPREAFVRDGKVRMLHEIMPLEEVGLNVKWHKATSALLGTGDSITRKTNYIGPFVTWRRDNLVKLRNYIEGRTGQHWAEGLLRQFTMSEYVLYGLFCEGILKEKSGHYLDPMLYTLNYWEEREMLLNELHAFRDSLQDEHIGVHISARSETPIGAIRREFGFE